MAEREVEEVLHKCHALLLLKLLKGLLHLGLLLEQRRQAVVLDHLRAHFLEDLGHGPHFIRHGRLWGN